MTRAAGWLEGALGYRFSDTGLLERALTHRSAGGRHNERLEYLGDAALGFVVAEALYRSVPEADEGDLSRLRASLVNRPALAVMARELGLPDRLRLGSGELKSGGFRRESILADALEAVLGAVYLDGGFSAVRRCVLALYGKRLEQLPGPEALKDAKTRLQEALQAEGRSLPSYEVEAVEGEAHRRRFTVACRVEGEESPAIGRGRSRRAAEQSA
ncbi:MAG: ribonuclease III, partial [Anaerolineae bacterium]